MDLLFLVKLSPLAGALAIAAILAFHWRQTPDAAWRRRARVLERQGRAATRPADWTRHYQRKHHSRQCSDSGIWYSIV